MVGNFESSKAEIRRMLIRQQERVTEWAFQVQTVKFVCVAVLMNVPSIL